MVVMVDSKMCITPSAIAIWFPVGGQTVNHQDASSSSISLGGVAALMSGSMTSSEGKSARNP